jgi:hypothetical protein
VVGSVNMDVTAEVSRLPLKGETTLSTSPSVSLAVGGKVRRLLDRHPYLVTALCWAGGQAGRQAGRQPLRAMSAMPRAAGSQPGRRSSPPQQQHCQQ